MKRVLEETNLQCLENTSLLIPLQEGIFFDYAMQEGKTGYILQDELKLYGRIEADKVLQALQLIMLKHEVFKTAFADDGKGNIRQYIVQERELDFKIIDLTPCNKSLHKKNIDQVAKKNIESGFDLKNDVLFRCRLIILNDFEGVLLCCYHHIIIDNWSMPVVYSDFMRYYELLLSKQKFSVVKKIVLEEKRNTVSYQDYIKWFISQDNEEKLQYWKTLLSDYNETANIRPSIRNPHTSGRKVSEKIICLTEMETQKIIQLGEQYHINLNIVAEAAWAVVLQQYCYAKDVVYGRVITGRNTDMDEIKNTVGLFIETIPVRVSCQESTTLEELARQLKHQESESSKMAHCSLADIQRETRQKNQLIKTLFVFESDKEEKENIENQKSGVEIRFFREWRQNNYDVTVSAFLRHGKLHLGVHYNANKYLANEMHYMLERIKKLVKMFYSSLNMKIANLDLVLNKEKNQILQEFNRTEAVYPNEYTFIELFEQQVYKNPECIALQFQNSKLSYDELNKKANQLAYRLRELGVKPKDFAAICVEKSIEMVIGILGILKTGAAYVPLDPAYPMERIQYILKDCQPKVVLTYGTDIDVEEIQVCRLELETMSGGADRNTEHHVCPKDLAYMIYTSGTTGNPKGVMVENRNLVNFCACTEYNAFQRELISKCDTVLSIGRITFDISIQEIELPLMNGKTVCVLTEEELYDINRIIELSEQNSAFGLIITPSRLKAILKEGYFNSIWKKMQVIMIGAEVFPKEIFLELRKQTDAVIYNGYGPTETTCGVLYQKVEDVKKITIGQPISNTKVYIQSDSHLCGIGVPGELCISGAGVTRGYLNNQSLSEQVYVNNPYGAGRMYKTGDLACWLLDGTVDYLGRIDEQVKVRGFRIELGEIEAAARKIEGVTDTAVVVKKDLSGDNQIYLYYTADTKIETDVIRESLGRILPEYMVPSYSMQIDSIPITQNGKLDRKALPDVKIHSKKKYIAPRNEIEEILCKVYTAVLGIIRIGIRDSFFEVGGDSIKAIRIVSKMRNEGYSISVKDIMEKLTIERIALSVTEAASIMEYEQGDVTGLVCTTPIIKQFTGWKLKVPNHFNQDIMFRVETEQVVIIRKALNALTIHHDILRSVYRDGKLNILSSKESRLYDFSVFDFRNNSKAASQISEECTMIQAGIDLENGPLTKTALFQTIEGNYLFICIHHLVIDGLSWRVLLEDFHNAVSQQLRGEEICLHAKTASFKEWAKALMEYKNTRFLKRERVYWEAVIKEAAESGLKLEKHKNKKSYKTILAAFTVEETEQLLHEALKAFSTKIDDLLLSAVGMAIGKLTKQDKITVMLEGHGREEIHKKIDIDRTVGWFTTIYPVVLKCCDNEEEMIVNTKDMLRRIPNHGLGYGLLFDEQNIIQNDISYNYLGQMDAESEAEFYTTGKRISDENEMFSAISFSGIIVKGALHFSIKYDCGIYPEVDMECCAKYFRESLCSILKYCTSVERTKKTPSDYSDLNLSILELNKIINLLGSQERLEDVYSLTPLQEGILYHKLVKRDSFEYLTQNVYELKWKEFDEERFIQTLYLLGRKHEVLRTVIFYKNFKSPKQIILKDREIEYIKINLEGVDEKERKHNIQDILYADLKRGFELDKDSLIRVTAILLEDNRYQMIWTFHHIIMDGWCLALLFGDLEHYYNLLTQGKTVTEVMEIVQEENQEKQNYGAYVKWLYQQDTESGLKYWKDMLCNYKETTTIEPLGILESSNKQTEREKRVLSVDITEKLKKLAVDTKVTINTISEAAWGILLQIYNHTKDVVFGKVISGRDADVYGIENIVGLFINTIPVRVSCTDETTSIRLLHEIRRQENESQRYSYCSLADVQEQSGEKAELIQSLFIFENYLDDNEKEELHFKLLETREQTNYAICVLGGIDNGALRFQIMYNPGEYAKKEIETILERLEKVLEAFALEPGIKVCEIEALTEGEENKILKQFNNTRTQYPRNKTVADLFEEQAEKTPDKAAVVFGGVSLTYRELNERAENLALKLRKLGTKAGDFVGIMAERSIEMVLGICGILKAGGAYVPLDAAYPKERIDFMLKDCRPKAVLVYQAELETKLPVIDLSEQGLFREKQEPWGKRKSGPEDLAYCIYTSGTTGNPKGSMIENRSIVRLVKNTDYVELNETSIILQTGSVAFDASTFEIWGALLNGGTLILAENEVITSSRSLKEYIKKYQVTTMWLTSSLFNQMIKSEEGMFDHLKNLLIGGEKLSEEHVRILKKRKNGIRLLNGYGPTENTTFTTTYEIPEEFDRIPIGKPIANTQVYILDGKKLCGIGVPGELCIAGDGLSRGYLNQPELTTKSFVKNPYGDGKLYHSGDLARWLPDGNIEYMGRIDNQVKIRGFRVELSAIRNVMLKIDGIEDAAVVARADGDGDKAVFAYYVSTREIGNREVRETLKESLPKYMIPSYTMQIETMPVTRNGKLDERALPEVERKAEGEYQAPRNEKEKKLCEAFEEILGVKKVGIRDNFFELGGHSLKATKLVNLVEEKTGYRLPLNEIFTNPTPEKLTQCVKWEKEENLISLPHAQIKKSYPMSSMQKRVFFVCQLDENGISYNMPQYFRLRGNVKVDAIKGALQEMFRRHEILRTEFVIESGEPVQKIRKSVETDFLFLMNEISSEEQLMTEFTRPFSLGHGPLVRMQVVKRKDYYLIMLDMHHIISDGMSLGTFLKELVALYNGEELLELTNQYKDFSEWFRKRDLSRQKEYWVKQFSDDIPVLDIPCDFKRPSVQSFRGAVIAQKLGKKLSDALGKQARKMHVTEYMVFLASAMILLKKYSRQDDVIVGSPISGRTHKDTEKMLGMFVNTLAMRGHPEGQKRYDEFLYEIKDLCVGAYDNQEYPFEELVEALNVRRDMSRNPLFDVMLVLQNNEQPQLEFQGADSEYIIPDSIISKSDLKFDISKEQGEYKIELEYCVDLFSRENVSSILDHYLYVINQVIDNEKIKINDISTATQTDREKIHHIFNATSMPYEKDKTVIDLFRGQVREHPEKIAVDAFSEIMTYRELDQKSDRLAAALDKAGTGKGDYVAILAKRCKEMIVGILAVLKSGAAYIPIDYTYPDGRIEYIVKDCRPKVILTAGAYLKFQTDCMVMNLMDEKTYSDAEKMPERVLSPEDTAYVIYTSGTTGNPKGVMIEHHSLLTNILYSAKVFLNPNKDIVVPLFTNYSFDLTIPSIYLPLCLGGMLDLIDEEHETDIGYILSKKEYTFIKMTPSLLRTLSVPKEKLLLEHLYCMVVGGEILETSLVNRILRKYGTHIKLLNEYGPTEATVGSTLYSCSVTEEQKAVPIGRPFANTQIYIMDETTLCGIGVPGEICIAGDQIARGYINKSELTAKKFVDNPYGNGKLYRTGDLARWRPDGNIEYLGRIDEQVKVRGYRIETEEISAVIKRVSGVSNAVVIVREDKSKDLAIYAYYVSEAEITPDYMRGQIKTTLPEYMMPTYMAQIDTIPITKNGKIDKRALPDIAVKSAAKYYPPKTPVQKLLCQVFSEVLCVDPVGIYDSFFELGGDSIKAIRVVSKMRDVGYEVSIREIMKKYTPEGIAESVLKTIKNTYQQEEVNGNIRKTPIIQDFLKRNWKHPECFNQKLVIETRLKDERAIRKVLETLAFHHDMLRMVCRDGEFVILSSQKSKLFELTTLDVSKKEKPDVFIRDYIKNWHDNVDLENGPLWKNVLFTGEKVNSLYMCIHHLVIDSISWQILVEDFQTAEKAIIENRSIILPAKTASFMQWATALDEYKNSWNVLEEKTYWDSIISKSACSKPLTQIDSERNEYADIQIKFSKEETRQLLLKASKAFSTEINDLLLSALGRAIYKLTGQTFLAVGLEGHGREEICPKTETDRTIGWFTIKYPVVLNCCSDIKQSIITTKEMLKRVPAHGLGYGLLYGDFQGIQADIYFNYLGKMDLSETSEFILMTDEETERANPICGSIDMNGCIQKEQLVIIARYNQTRFAEKTVEQLMGLYQECLLENVKYCLAQKETIKTASDYTASDLVQKDFETITEEVQVDDIYSLTALQEGMLYHSMSEEESTSYITQVIYSVTGNVDLQVVEEALNLLPMRHEVLKTAIFHHKIIVPRQVLVTGRKIEFVVRNLGAFSKEEQEKKAGEIAEENVRRGFILNRDPLLRVLFLFLGNHEYKLIWSYHHIIFDGWCSTMLFGDFLNYYRLLSKGMEKFEIEQMIQNQNKMNGTYGEYIEWLKRQDKEKGLEYWKSLLEGYEEIAEIKPMEKTKATKIQMNRIRRSLPEDMSKKLTSAASGNQVTLNTVVETAWGIVLQQYCHSKDVVFGKVVSGRNADIKGIETIVGLFVNTIPVRVTCKEGSTILQLLKEMNKQGMESDSYAYCSLTDIQALTTQRNDLIKVLYAFENYYIEQEKIKSDDIFAYKMETAREQTNYTITLSVCFELGKLHCDIMYNPGEYAKKEIETILERLEKVLEAFALEPGIKVCEIEALTEGEENKIFKQFNNTRTQYPRNKTVADLFEEQAEKTPDKAAVVFGGVSLTYRELNERAENLALKLRKLGTKAGDFVGIMAERSIEMVLGICGILKAGGAYVPLDAAYPKERIDFMLKDCRPKAVLVYQAELETKLPVIDLSEQGLFREKQEPWGKRKSGPEDLAYCIYTSGTTGNPKGSMIENRSIVRLVKNTDYVELNETSIILQTGSVAFDASTFEIWGALLNGGTLILAENEVITSSRSLKEYIKKYQVTTMWLTSSLFNQMIKSEEGMFDHLKNLLIGGEKLSEEHVRILKKRKNGIRLLNGYGPTENTTFTTTYEIPEEFDRIPIGKPIANTQVYILDGKKLCGIGVPGELCIAGDGLSRGYLNQPELTTKSFVKNPYGDGKLYHSGDLARWLPDGNIEYMGRIDNQVKIRGFRVELSAIRNVMLKIDGIEDAAVVARADGDGDKAVFAYYVSTREIGNREVRETLKESLPKYMIPSYTMQIETMPVTRNGKLDERALPEVERKAEGEYQAPRDEKEKKLCEAFEEILGVKKAGIRDNFFELGGDSIKAIRVVSKIRNAGYEVSVKDIMNRYTVESISFVLKEANKNEYEQEEVTGEVILTPIMQQFLLWNLKKPNHFNQDVLLDTDMTETEVKKILDAIWKHHDMLRSVFNEGRLMILNVEESQGFDLEVIDLSESKYYESSIEEICSRLQSSIDLETGPLMKLALFHLKTTSYLLLCIHHLVVDGVSLRILLDDIHTAKKQIRDGKNIELPAKTASFKQWSESLEEYRKSAELLKERVYWKNIINCMSNGNLRLSEESLETGQGEQILYLDNQNTSDLLFEAGKAYNTEINDLLLSALGMAVRELTGQSTVTVGLEGHGREEIHKKIKIDRTVGWFTSMYPVIIPCANEVEDSIISTKEMLRDVPNHGIGYGLLPEGKDLVSDIYFNYLGQMDAESEKQQKIHYLVGKSFANENTLDRNININGSVTNGELKFRITYKRCWISDETIIKFSELFKNYLLETIEFCTGRDEMKMTISDLYASNLDTDDLSIINSLFEAD